MSTPESMESAEFVERNSCLACGGSRLAPVSQGQFDEGRLAAFIAQDPWGENPLPYLRGKPWMLVKCEDCGQRFHRYILSPAWNEIRFSKWMSGEAIAAFEKRHGGWEAFQRGKHFAAHVLSICRLFESTLRKRTLRVLDFGSGNGEFLAACTSFGMQAHGVDRSMARRETSGRQQVHETLEDAARFGPFDAITLFEVLEHVDDPRELVSSLRKLLADDGILVIETPDCQGVDSMEMESHYRAIHPLDHINAFEGASLQKLVESTGFTRMSRPVVFSTELPAKVLKNLARIVLGRSEGSPTQQYFRKN